MECRNVGQLAVSTGASDVVNTGTIAVSGGAVMTFYDDVVQNGQMSVSRVGATNSTVVFLGSYSGSGGVAGRGSMFF